VLGTGRTRVFGELKVFEWAVDSLQTRRLIQTVKVAWSLLLDFGFDWYYGTDTLAWVREKAIETGSSNKSHSSPYRATKFRPMLRLLSQLELPRDCTFVDIGAGKGRALLIASRYGFRRVLGIEFSPSLCDIARKNIAVFSARAGYGSTIEVLEADAAAYCFGPDDSVLFMYNPFDGHVMQALIRNLQRSLEVHPRPLWLIYNTPQYHDALGSCGLFRQHLFSEIGGNHFRIYKA
jgi:SAM-dependent methyltransferase